jgi:hypothetical protein
MTGPLNNPRGSILIVVLWTLIMISYLVGDYLVHNRSKTGTAMNLMTSFRHQNAIESLVHLTATDEWQTGLDDYFPEKWVDITVAGVLLRFRLDKEDGRININSAGDGEIRQAMVDILGEPDIEKADMLTDVLLDWRDTNDLVRANGAEARNYMAAGLGYLPADGPFKTLTEALMLLGMTPAVFWGEPGNNPHEAGDGSDQTRAFMEAFTIFDGSTRRLSILIPLQKKSARFYMVLFFNEQKILDVVEQYTAFLEGQVDL